MLAHGGHYWSRAGSWPVLLALGGDCWVVWLVAGTTRLCWLVAGTAVVVLALGGHY